MTDTNHRYVYVVAYDWHTVGICSTEAEAIECAKKAHRLDGFKYSVWVTRRLVDAYLIEDDRKRARLDDQEVGMFKRFPNGPRQESPWIPHKEAWEYEPHDYTSIHDHPRAWIPMKP